MTMAQDCGKVASIYPQKIYLVLISVRGRVDIRAIAMTSTAIKCTEKLSFRN
jgi:hypothetical protein